MKQILSVEPFFPNNLLCGDLVDMGLGQNPIPLTCSQILKQSLRELWRAVRNDRWSHFKLWKQRSEIVKTQPHGPNLPYTCVLLDSHCFCVFFLCCQHLKIEVFSYNFWIPSFNLKIRWSGYTEPPFPHLNDQLDLCGSDSFTYAVCHTSYHHLSCYNP